MRPRFDSLLRSDAVAKRALRIAFGDPRWVPIPARPSRFELVLSSDASHGADSRTSRTAPAPRPERQQCADRRYPAVTWL